MSTNVTITYSDISELKSEIENLKGKSGEGVAVFSSKNKTTSPKTINDVSFILLEIEVTMKKKETSAKIVVPSSINSSFLDQAQGNFIVLSDVKSESGDGGFYSSSLYKSIKSAKSVGTAGGTIGEVFRNTAPEKDVPLVVDILFISLTP